MDTWRCVVIALWVVGVLLVALAVYMVVSRWR